APRREDEEDNKVKIKGVLQKNARGIPSSVLYRSVKLEQKRTMEKQGDKNKMKHVVDSGVMTRSKARSSDLMVCQFTCFHISIVGSLFFVKN
ncbi:unnamed protein product, partial [Linum tenue]